MTDAEVDARIRWLEETFYKAWPSSVALVPVPQAPASFRTKERFEKLEKAGESVGICPCFPYLELFALADQAKPSFFDLWCKNASQFQYHQVGWRL